MWNPFNFRALSLSRFVAIIAPITRLLTGNDIFLQRMRVPSRQPLEPPICFHAGETQQRSVLISFAFWLSVVRGEFSHSELYSERSYTRRSCHGAVIQALSCPAMWYQSRTEYISKECTRGCGMEGRGRAGRVEVHPTCKGTSTK